MIPTRWARPAERVERAQGRPRRPRSGSRPRSAAGRARGGRRPSGRVAARRRGPPSRRSAGHAQSRGRALARRYSATSAIVVPGPKTAADAGLGRAATSSSGMIPPAVTRTSSRPSLAEELRDPRQERHVGARQDRQPDDVDVLLEGRRRRSSRASGGGRCRRPRSPRRAGPRARTLAPRSWPSRPGLAMSTLIGRSVMGRLCHGRGIRPGRLRRRTRWRPLPFGRRSPNTAGDRIRRRRHPEGRRRRRPRGAGAGPQATARLNVREAIHTANSASAPMIAGPDRDLRVRPSRR